MELANRMALAVGVLCAAQTCFAGPHPNIPQMVHDSTLIVIANVGQVKYVGPTQTVLNGRVFSGGKYEAEAVALYSLKGSSPGQFTIEFAAPDGFQDYRSVELGTRMIFLKNTASVYVPTTPYYPDFPAVPSPPPELQGRTVVEQVFAELGAVVASADASSADREYVLMFSFAIPKDNKLFLRDLVIGAQNSPDPSVHWWIEAELINRNDVSQFPEVCNAVSSGTLPADQQSMVLYAIGTRLTNPKALPELTRLVSAPEPQVRAAAVEAVGHVSSSSSLNLLAQALHDPDSQVRYYAIRGLDDITGQPGWGPGPSEYEEHGDKYLQHWLDWASDNLPQPKH